MSLNKKELLQLLELLQKGVEYLKHEKTRLSCDRCEHFKPSTGKCDHWDSVVPDEVVSQGCDEWIQGIPF